MATYRSGLPGRTPRAVITSAPRSGSGTVVQCTCGGPGVIGGATVTVGRVASAASDGNAVPPGPLEATDALPDGGTLEDSGPQAEVARAIANAQRIALRILAIVRRVRNTQ